MKILFIYNEVENENSADDADVLVQLTNAKSATEELGYETEAFPVTLNLSGFENKLAEYKPDIVFNLVEAISGVEAYMHFIPQLLERNRVKFTGCSSEALYLTTNKVLSKKIMKLNGIQTPEWFTANDLPESNSLNEKTFIIKPVSADASIGLDDGSIIRRIDLLKYELSERSKKFGECFAEEFIDGREFNLSIIEIDGKPLVMTPAEMIFYNYPDNKFKLLGYKAKWEENSFEYQNTARTFEFTNNDLELIENLKRISLKCYEVFGLGGYARVDFRVANSGEIYVLEINANPCLSPDAGFTAACEISGMNYIEMITMIINSAK